MDRVGIGWRKELSIPILSNLDQIDLVEIIIDDYLDFTRKQKDELKFLKSQTTITFHGIQLGLASTYKVETKRISRYARVLDFIQPEYWSEHLAFVRAGNQEIGHLCAPPMNSATLESTLENLHIVEKITQSRPRMENPATVLFPPMSEFSETEWIGLLGLNMQNDFLLDLHNLYANSINFSFDPIQYIKNIPCDKIRTVHVAGGQQKSKNLILDTHAHAIPEEVFSLLEFLGTYVDHDLDIILERDGRFPIFGELLEEIEKVRSSLQKGRRKKNELSRI